MNQISINDIEELILLADDVIDQAIYHFHFCDDNGDSVDSKIRKLESEGKFELAHEEIKKLENLYSSHSLVWRIIHEKNYSLIDAMHYSAEELLKLVESIKVKIIKTFRCRGLFYTADFYADETLTDEYLLKLFAMRLRDRMIVIAAKREVLK